jgi:hypothetical protein
MEWRSRADDPGYEELFDEANRMVAAFGPNPFGMMGQNWKRGWVFDPETTKQVGMAVFAPHQERPDIRKAMEKMVAESNVIIAAKKLKEAKNEQSAGPH